VRARAAPAAALASAAARCASRRRHAPNTRRRRRRLSLRVACAVLVETGISYCAACIGRQLQLRAMCPATGQPLRTGAVVPNYLARSLADSRRRQMGLPAFLPPPPPAVAPVYAPAAAHPPPLPAYAGAWAPPPPPMQQLLPPGAIAGAYAADATQPRHLPAFAMPPAPEARALGLLRELDAAAGAGDAAAAAAALAALRGVAGVFELFAAAAAGEPGAGGTPVAAAALGALVRAAALDAELRPLVTEHADALSGALGGGEPALALLAAQLLDQASFHPAAKAALCAHGPLLALLAAALRRAAEAEREPELLAPLAGALCNLASDPDSWNALLGGGDAVPGLVAALSPPGGRSAAVLECAAGALSNLACWADAAERALAAGAAPALVALLTHDHCAVARAACGAICNCTAHAADGGRVAELLEAGAVPGLVVALVAALASGDALAQARAAKALGNLALGGEAARAAALAAGAAPVLVAALAAEDRDALDAAAGAACNLSHSPAAARALVAAGAVAALSALLPRAAAEVARQAQGALRNLAATAELAPAVAAANPRPLMRAAAAAAPVAAPATPAPAARAAGKKSGKGAATKRKAPPAQREPADGAPPAEGGSRLARFLGISVARH